MKKLKFIISLKYITCSSLLVFLLSNFSVFAQIPGAAQSERYLPILKGKKVALVVNQTSMNGNKHLVDFLLAQKIKVSAIFAPEHGFRGDHSAGEKVKSSIDSKTKLPVYSLYGAYKKPNAEQLQGVDIVVFDIQDVGARFDGPVLDTAYRSFVGMHPVPIVHGCTVAEYAKMINGEGWLKNHMKCRLEIIAVKNYTHQTSYKLPVKPSPNLPNMSSIYLYPSLCLFEGTPYSVGRGTKTPFEIVGKPGCTLGSDSFTPVHMPGIEDHPPFEGKKCNGFLLSDYGNNLAPYQGKINLFWLIELYKAEKEPSTFFTPFFDKLAGTPTLRLQISAGKSEEEIRASWQKDLQAYKKMRRKYLIYSSKE